MEAVIKKIKLKNILHRYYFSLEIQSVDGQVYYGVGYPIGIGSAKDEEKVKVSALLFQSFILNIMKFYGVDDLLKLSWQMDKYPIVDITFDKNKVKYITSLETGIGFSIGKSYEIINVFEPEKVKLVK